MKTWSTSSRASGAAPDWIGSCAGWREVAGRDGGVFGQVENDGRHYVGEGDFLCLDHFAPELDCEAGEHDGGDARVDEDGQAVDVEEGEAC